eukprot:CAMPEP_0115231056 /NCGR_PEP_ID=MMETSP0270-20121206/33034_1 /TAXON_ID=71861 /ORGANISM="Scrippsiella trochoidea, Strain CCMP3099" /LENGTH=335 /DNA_ID=CAMNT_0002645667 /DNA_START=333 /DNA_END=1344 /DNA_ORIENTATION=-
MLQQACLIVIAPAGKLLAVAGKRMAASAVETIVVEELLLEVTELLDAALFAHNALAKPQAQAMPAQLIAIVTWPPAACRCLCRWRELLPQRWRSRRPNHAMLQQTCCLLSGPAASFWLQHNSGHCRLVALAHAACRTIAVEDCPDIVEASRAPLEATGGAQYIVAQTLGPAQTLAILTRLDTRDDARAIPAVACGLDTHRDSAAEWRRCGECEVCPEAHAATRAAAIEGREGVVVDLAPGTAWKWASHVGAPGTLATTASNAAEVFTVASVASEHCRAKAPQELLQSCWGSAKRHSIRNSSSPGWLPWPRLTNKCSRTASLDVCPSGRGCSVGSS